jgi:PAS domain S-box-containing protein
MNKTNKELLDELEALRKRVSELEKREINSRQALGNFGERTNRCFPQTIDMNMAMYVVFNRKFEFANDRFAELFGVSSEEACGSNFDPMTLIAPESRLFVQEQYREGCRGGFSTKQIDYTGLSKDGLKIECDTFLVFIPYKWGTAIQGMLRSISVNKRIDDALPRHHSDLPVVLNTVPTGIIHSDRDLHLMQAMSMEL